MAYQPRQPDPSPEEIRRRCWEIQSEWDPWERFVRSGGRDKAALVEAEAEDRPPVRQYLRDGRLPAMQGQYQSG